MKILVTHTKGGSGKTTLTTCLADVINADLIDYDNQGTLRVASIFTKRNKPILTLSNATKECIIIDTPPYNFDGLKNLLAEADIVLIPSKLQYADLLALRGVYDHLKDLKVLKKALLIYNEVRKPYNKNYYELKKLYDQNYPDLKKSPVELSQLVAYSKSLAEPIKGKALNEILALVDYLKVPKNILKKEYV